MPAYDESCQLPYHERRVREERERAREQHAEKLQLVEELGDAVHPAYRALLENKGHRAREDCYPLVDSDKISTNGKKPFGRAGTRRRTGSGRQVCLFLDASILERIDELAHERGASRSQVAAELLEQALALGHNSLGRNPS